jgi:hypothetical protein
MKANNRILFTFLALVALMTSLWAETPASGGPAAKDGAVATKDAAAAKDGAAATPASAAPAAAAPAPPTITAADVQALKDALASQQLQIERLEKQLELQQAWQQTHQAAVQPAIVPETAQPPVPPQQQAALVNPVAAQPAPVQPAAVQPVAIQSDGTPLPGQNLQDAQGSKPNPMESPVISIHFRGITITPGGYVEGAFVRRSRGLGADLPTPFNNLTMPGASQSDLPEFFGSARQSKVTTFVDGRSGNVGLSAYVSADFLSAGVTSTSTQTNSYTLRLRQAWGQAKFDDGWSFLAGQEWSLVTENGHGISPDDDLGRTNDARPKTIDPSYNVGFVFARQYGLRVTKTFGDKVAFAVSMEAPQATLTSHGNGANFLLGEAGASNSYNTTANYSFNPSPDLIAKIAFDPGFGHYEIFGLFDRFRDRIFPCGEVAATASCAGQPVGVTSAIGAFDASKDGGGVGASARWNIAKRVTFGLKAFDGSGIGRYGPGGLPDVSINGDGTLHLVKNALGLATFEIHAAKKLDIYTYTGAEYASRTASFDPISGKQVGYGAPGFNNSGCYTETPPTTANGSAGFDPGSLANCTADTRMVVEGTAGFWYRFYDGPRGSFRFGPQYSYVDRSTWSGTGGEPHGIDNMFFTSFRYYLP